MRISSDRLLLRPAAASGAFCPPSGAGGRGHGGGVWQRRETPGDRVSRRVWPAGSVPSMGSGYRRFPVVSNARSNRESTRCAASPVGRAGPLDLGTTTVMPTTTQGRSRSRRPSTAYRDRMLLVTRGSPLPRGGDSDAQRDQFRLALPARDGGLAGPLRAVRRRDPCRDPARSAAQPDGRPLACPRRRPARGVLLRLPGRRPEGQRPPIRSRDHLARPLHAGPLVRPAVGGRRADCPAAA